MAKIKFGAIAAEARGKLGGIVFSKNSSSAYIRKYTKPVNTNTGPQNVIRAFFAYLTGKWRLLTAGQRQTFFNQRNNYPQTNSLGDVTILTAQQLYMKLNMNLLTANQPETQVGIPPVTIPEIPDFLPVVDFSLNSMVISHEAITANETLIIEATRDMSAGRGFVSNSDFKQIFLIPGVSAPATPNINSNYFDVFGKNANEMLIGSKVFFRLSIMKNNSGQRGDLRQQEAIVQA